MVIGSRWTPPRRVDQLVGALIALWIGVPQFQQLWQPTSRSSIGFRLPLIAGGAAEGAAFLRRRPAPMRVLAISLGAYALERATVSGAGAGVAVLVASYGVGAYTDARLRRIVSWIAGLVLAISVSVALGLTRSDHFALALALALTGGALLFGQVQASRADAMAASAEAGSSAERARIARDLHDVLVHQLSAIAVQAGAARIAGNRHYGSALLIVETQARQALAELDHLLGVLRRPGDENVVLTPAPTLEQVPILIAHANDAGITASLEVSGRPRTLGAAAELSGYRIVQEALTNVVAHAPGAPACVRLCYEADHLAITIRNAAGAKPALTTRRGGHGLVGMQERVAMLGGFLTALPAPDGGFCVTTNVPYAATTPGDTP